LKKTIERAFRIAAIAVLSACTAVDSQTISQNLGSAERERIQRDYAECHLWAESQWPKVSYRDVLVPVSAAFLVVVIGAMVEYKQRLPGGKIPDDHNQPGGNAIIAFSIAGVAVDSGIIVAGIISRQRVEDATMRSCIKQRGYTVPGDTN
jgi:hypothetical protein